MAVNLLNLCEAMTKSYIEESRIRVPFNVFRKFATKNHFIIKSKIKNNKRCFKLFRKEIPVYYISGEEEREFFFLDLGDIHIGNKFFDEASLRKRLAEALDKGVKYVFIAGDLFECFHEKTKGQYLSQIEYAYSIFKDYPLEYFSINGNHEYSYEQMGFENPTKYLSILLKKNGIVFHQFDEYIMDFIICGIIKRVMHIENISKEGHDREWSPAFDKLDSFDEDELLQNIYKGRLYTVRIFQIGHVHVNMQKFYSKKKVFVSQAGSFIGKEPYEKKGSFIKGRVANKKVIVDPNK